MLRIGHNQSAIERNAVIWKVFPMLLVRIIVLTIEKLEVLLQLAGRVQNQHVAVDTPIFAVTLNH